MTDFNLLFTLMQETDQLKTLSGYLYSRIRVGEKIQPSIPGTSVLP